LVFALILQTNHKTMKTVLKPFYVVAIAITFLVSSCILDEDVDPTPTDPIEKFLGSWSVSDNEMKLNYEVTISRDPNNSTMVLLSNFAGSGGSAKALAVGSSLVVESQTIGQNWLVSGTGTYRNTSRIDFPYALTIGGNQESRSAIFTR
jgi:hypothetical protein